MSQVGTFPEKFKLWCAAMANKPPAKETNETRPSVKHTWETGVMHCFDTHDKKLFTFFAKNFKEELVYGFMFMSCTALILMTKSCLHSPQTVSRKNLFMDIEGKAVQQRLMTYPKSAEYKCFGCGS